MARQMDPCKHACAHALERSHTHACLTAWSPEIRFAPTNMHKHVHAMTHSRALSGCTRARLHEERFRANKQGGLRMVLQCRAQWRAENARHSPEAQIRPATKRIERRTSVRHSLYALQLLRRVGSPKRFGWRPRQSANSACANPPNLHPRGEKS